MTKRRSESAPISSSRIPAFLAVRGEPLGVMAAALAGLVAFAWRMGLRYADPCHTEWLFGTDDTAMFQIGWMFFRAEGWGWPLGTIAGYLFPDGANIALTDSLPLFALPFKLVAGALPDVFQYFGLWLLVSHVLQAVFSWLLARRFVDAIAPRVLAAALLFLAPVFLHRDGHIALSGHWVFPAALWLYARRWDAADWQRTVLGWAALVFVTAQIHAYPAVMVGGLAVSALVRDRWPLGRLTTGRLAIGLGALAVVLAVVWLGVGYLQPGDVTRYSGSTYAHSALNLNFPWNGVGYLRLTPDRPIAVENTFEAFNAPGLGVLVAVLVAAGLVVRKRDGFFDVRAHLPLLFVCAIFLAVAISNRVALGGDVLFTGGIPGALQPFLDSFRAAARFAWPTVYALGVAAVAMLARRMSARGLTAVLAACLLLQAVDVSPLWSRREAYGGLAWRSNLTSPEWDAALADADKLLTYPPYMKHTTIESDFIDLALLARGHDVPTSAGYSARIFRSDVESGVETMKDLLLGDAVDPGAVFVLRWSYWAVHWPQLDRKYVSTRIDDVVVCVPREAAYRPELIYEAEEMTLGDVLARSIEHTVILATKGGMGGALDADTRAALREAGSGLAGVGTDDSYLMIMDGGSIRFERSDVASQIALDLPPGQPVGNTTLGRPLLLISAGRRVGDLASLQVDGHEMALNLPGLNILVLDKAQDVVATGYLDPAKGPHAKVFRLVPPVRPR